MNRAERSRLVSQCAVLLLELDDACVLAIVTLLNQAALAQSLRPIGEAGCCRGPWVYLIQAGEAGPVKIGFSKDPEARLKQLGTPQGPPLHLRQRFVGGRPLEKALHEAFRELRLDGEWFSFAGELRGLVRGELGLPDVLDVSSTELAELQGAER